MFPNGGVPFGGFGESAEPELRGVGNRAYDRWLLDFANELPGRRAALAMLTVHDLDATAAECVRKRLREILIVLSSRYYLAFQGARKQCT